MPPQGPSGEGTPTPDPDELSERDQRLLEEAGGMYGGETTDDEIERITGVRPSAEGDQSSEEDSSAELEVKWVTGEITREEYLRRKNERRPDNA